MRQKGSIAPSPSVEPHDTRARRDVAIGRSLSIATLAVWPLLYAERFITAPPAVMDLIHVLMFVVVVVAMLCMWPLILYTFRVIGTPAPAWQQTFVAAGLIAGVASYGFVLFAYFFGIGLAMGAH